MKLQTRSVHTKRPVAKESPRSKRRQIVKAATKVFLSNGYEGTSIADVAAAAGVIKATIYSHFKDKNALFTAIIEDLTLEQGFDKFESGAEHLPPDQFIELLGQRIASRRNDKQFRDLIRVVIGESGRFPDLARLFYETVTARGVRAVSNYIAAKPELGIADPQAAAHILIGSIVYWMLSQEVLGGKHVAPIEPERIIRTLQDLFACTTKKTNGRRPTK